MSTAAARLLMVDDNELNRDLLGRRLRRAGYQVTEAAHGRDALDLLAREAFDLVLLDIMMPDIDGLRVLSKLRETRTMADLPVIMVSAKDRSQDLLEAFNLGANDYVTKPVDFAVLTARIQAQLTIRAARAERKASSEPAAGGPGSSGVRPPPAEAGPAPASPDKTRVLPLSSSRAAAMFWGSAEELPRGTRLGNYVICGLLGRGGMGVVYEAENAALGRQAAVKILPRSLSADPQALARFRQEARAAARIEHPNVVGVYDVGEWDGHHFIVMQLVRGGTAQTLLESRRAPVPWRDATRIAVQACRGLAAAHACGVLHRDIKPSNIMVGAEGAVKLGDFGLAKVLEGAVAGTTLQGEVLGTPEFMSPEQCRNEPLDPRSDIYALGASYYALLAGRPPFEGNTVAVIYGQCFGDLPDPRGAAPDIPEACVQVVRKAMNKPPEHRYADAAGMLAALEGLAV
jgi:CheY-like chemotaxis protein